MSEVEHLEAKVNDIKKKGLAKDEEEKEEEEVHIPSGIVMLTNH